MAPLPIPDHESLGGAVYAMLCDGLMKGQFQPGDRLRIRELAEQLGTSVTPVRDAILRLAHDDAVVFRSPRDIRIPAITAARYREIRDMRLRLEALAAEAAALAATPDDIRHLEKNLRDNESALLSHDRRAATTLNQSFHFLLPQIAGMPVLQGVLRRLWLQMGPLIADSYDAGGRAMIDHHYPVVDAIRRRDPAGAAVAIMSDITLGGAAIAARVGQATESLLPPSATNMMHQNT
ncbi:GntR family transcriptional regulator [Haematobacter missouriensis]|uniref:GntR family transcriptional regulator n=2 Tax=Haematobacter missouriensis TaxID=366616 RepID=A0A212ASD3_9RHOB|nr:GntR family transcriptional regulator [Haematobacter missouriensis]OWJ74795.1 GntR family transcriptional regulator [Haematobacter missouriensis]OWJ84417.1 GntR family transcriptional regulator [Haematobacter missouriensis]